MLKVSFQDYLMNRMFKRTAFTLLNSQLYWKRRHYNYLTVSSVQFKSAIADLGNAQLSRLPLKWYTIFLQCLYFVLVTGQGAHPATRC